MKLRLFGFGLLSAVLALAAGGSAVGDDDKKKDDKPFDDKEFVQKAAGGGMFEVKLGEVAKSKASNDLVRRFGEKMVTDHTKANDELKTVAAAMRVELSDKLDEKHQKEFETINGKSGAEFDKAYIDNQVKGHEKMRDMYKKATQEAKNAELKAFAVKALPTVEEHLKMAKEIQGQVK